MADLFALTQEALVGMDVELVDVERAAMGLLRVTIDHAEGVTIERCQQVSNQLSRVYEVENIDYKRLEVGSPGVDRALRSEAEFRRFIGERVELRLREPAEDGRKSFTGILVLPEGEGAPDEKAPQQPASGGGKAIFGLEFEANKNDVQLLTFTIEDIDRAKLDPVLDFKGKKR
jgi:ribosome maturation factor RimP